MRIWCHIKITPLKLIIIFIFNTCLTDASLKLWREFTFRLLLGVLIVKTESTRSSSNKWTKTLYQDYKHRIANFCTTVLNIFSKKIISSNTKRQKQLLNFVRNTWKYSTGEMKLRMKFYLCLHNFSERWNYIFPVPTGNCFRCYFRQILYL